jgi:predicted nucleic acid-binding protein
MDAKKAIKEAKELGFQHLFTSQLLKQAERQGIISSYTQIYYELCNLGIFVPE